MIFVSVTFINCIKLNVLLNITILTYFHIFEYMYLSEPSWVNDVHFLVLLCKIKIDGNIAVWKSHPWCKGIVSQLLGVVNCCGFGDWNSRDSIVVYSHVK